MRAGSFIISSLLVPSTEEAAKDDELADVVGVVVGEEKRFAEEILPVTPAEGLVEIGGGVLDERFEALEVGADIRDGFVPGVL
jgi:hypothetical protein